MFEQQLVSAANSQSLESFLWSQAHFSKTGGVVKAMEFILGWIQGQAASPFTEERLKEIFTSIEASTKQFARYDFFQGQHVFALRTRFQELTSGSLDFLYLERLAIPHAQIDETMASYSTYVSSQDPQNYDTLLQKASKTYRQTKRQQSELELQLIKKQGESSEDYWYRVVQFIIGLSKKQRSSQIVPIFESALHEVGTFELWQQYVNNLFELVDSRLNMIVLRRFQQAYPQASQPYVELLNTSIMSIEEYKAQSWGLVVSDEDWQELQIAKLAYLTRKAENDRTLVSLIHTEAQTILADSWIHDTDSFHSVQRTIAAIYDTLEHGPGSDGDCNVDGKAREVWLAIVANYPREVENWLQLSCYEQRDTLEWPPVLRVLNDALNVSENFDWPERIFEEAMRVVQLHGDRDDYSRFKAKIEKKKIEVWKLRSSMAEHEPVLETPSASKRTADEMEDDDKEYEASDKKDTTTLARDREHLTIAAKNLPVNITDRQLRQFFKGYGVVKDIKLTVVGDTQQANIEFSSEDDIRKALTRDYKRIRGNEIRIQRLQNNTLFVTNFPPSYTQERLNELFGSVGGIASIRMPSLRFNSQRRFCYVEFTESSNAQAAVAIFHGKDIEGFKLSVLISDPSSKQSRSGANEEGREIYVGTLDFFKVTSDKLKQLFDKYGHVESVHLPLSEQNKLRGKKNDGYGFVVFKTPEEAQNSLQLDMVSFEGRVIHVSISKKKSELAEEKAKKALKDFSLSDSAIAVMNLPDTINTALLNEFFSSVDEVEEIILEPKHAGAIILFKNPQASGVLGLSLNGKNIGDYTIQIASVAELKRVDLEKKNTTTTATMLIPASMRRKRMGTMTNKPASQNSINSQPVSAPESAPAPHGGRSNDDFRKMFLNK